ncbi:hypothetical protein AJ80_07746 [Polytolypa hystricis UAMH7299]|uniref:FAD linked oxidase N-terminal domain-containing protein n=1 Tax=Polytolypa hystricis (strain UAMH7299) TaxID=1447883 RepID=A0A2B7XB49_POLH7|nr:hypothetical protein AJ80_07746 [Polytolypa hystricis UAMH7299]
MDYKKPNAPKRELAIPQGVEKEIFLKAIDELSGDLGKENVELVDKSLVAYQFESNNLTSKTDPNTHDGMHVLDEEEFAASAVVYPCNTEEFQTIVQWANKTKLFGYGGAAPRVRGSVVIDLGRRINKVLDINPDDCTCLLEPGVTFYALYEEIQARGYQHLWVDVPELRGGSVLGNTLDRDVG